MAGAASEGRRERARHEPDGKSARAGGRGVKALAGSETAAAEARTLAPFGRRPVEVVSNEEVGAYRLLSALDAPGPPNPRAGQFYMLAARAPRAAGTQEAGPPGRPYLPSAFSFCRVRPRSRDGGRGGAVVEFLLEEVGPGTEQLGALAAGDGLWLTGPLGIGFSPPREGRPLLVGGGIGVAPVLAWHDALGGDSRALLGFRSAAHAEASRLFATEPLLATDDGSAGRHAPVTDLLSEELDAHGEATVYACGPPAMLEAVRALCAERGFRGQLALESGMACGFGACYGCVAATTSGFVRLCVDGPVLDAAVLETAVVPRGGH